MNTQQTGIERLGALERQLAKHQVTPLVVDARSDVYSGYGRTLSLYDGRLCEAYAQAEPTGLRVGFYGENPRKLNTIKELGWVAIRSVGEQAIISGHIGEVPDLALIEPLGSWLIDAMIEDADKRQTRKVDFPRFVDHLGRLEDFLRLGQQNYDEAEARKKGRELLDNAFYPGRRYLQAVTATVRQPRPDDIDPLYNFINDPGGSSLFLKYDYADIGSGICTPRRVDGPLLGQPVQ